jgi:hypothetical protein
MMIIKVVYFCKLKKTFMLTWNISRFTIIWCKTKLKMKLLSSFNILIEYGCCCNPTLNKCEDDTHILEMGTWKSSETPKNSEFDCKGQNTLSWCVLYTIGKVLKCKCRKWPCMCHSNIYSISYGQKKGWESNWQFDSRPLKIGNRPNPGVSVCAGGVWHTIGKLLRGATSLL